MNNNNFFESFPYLAQMGDQFQKMFGDDFVRNLMNQMQVPNWNEFGTGTGGDRFSQGGPGSTGDGRANDSKSNGPGRAGAGNPFAGNNPGWMDGAQMWNPFGGMWGGSGPGAAGSGAGTPGHPMSNYPLVDIYETRHEVVLILEIPGMERSADIRLSVFPDHVIVKGDVPKPEAVARNSTPARAERHTGSFERNIPMPVRVRKQHAKAVYRAGLLEVRLLKEASGQDTDGNTIDVDFA